MKPNDSGLLAALSLFGYPLFHAQDHTIDLLADMALVVAFGRWD
jgi:hypothetical protein